MSWVKIEYYENGQLKSIETHSLFLSGNVQSSDLKQKE